MSIIPVSAAVADGELWEWYGSGNSAGQIVLSPGTLERFERPMMLTNTSGEDEVDRAEVQMSTKPEKRCRPVSPGNCPGKAPLRPGIDHHPIQAGCGKFTVPVGAGVGDNALSNRLGCHHGL